MNKASVASLASHRNGSGSYARQTRPSESQSTLSIPDPNRRSIDESDSLRAPFNSGSSSHSFELRKSKSSFFSRLRSYSSKGNLHESDGQSSEPTHPSLRDPVPPLPTPPFISFSSSHSNGSSFSLVPSLKTSLGKKDKGKKKSSQTLSPPGREQSMVLDHKIDLDINNMEGIIKQDVAHSHISSPSSGGSDYGSIHHPLPSPPEFLDPFSPSNVVVAARRQPSHYQTRRVSPKTPLPPNFLNGHRRTPSSTSASGSKSSAHAAWVAPQSWEVQQEEVDAVESTGYSSAEEGVYPATSKPRTAPATTDRFHNPPSAPPPLPAKGKRPRQRSSYNTPTYKIRIYRSNGSSHHAKVPFNSTVAELNKSLQEIVAKGGERTEQHKLYLDEGGRGMWICFPSIFMLTQVSFKNAFSMRMNYRLTSS